MLPVNLSGYRTKLRLQILILLDVLATRYSDLDQDYFIMEIRILIKEPVVSF